MSFSIARGGDWIDEQVAKSTGLPKEHVTTIKETVSKLDKEIKIGSPEGALTVYYDALMTYVIQNLNRKLAGITPPKVAFPVAIAGGSALPEGFFGNFERKLKESKLRIETSKIIRARDPLHSVARGCLIAAKTQEEKKNDKINLLPPKKEKEVHSKKHKKKWRK